MDRPWSCRIDGERILPIYGDDGLSCRDAAAHFDVSHSSAIRWPRRTREVGSPAASPTGGKRPFSLETERDWVCARLAEQPDITLRVVLAELLDRAPTSVTSPSGTSCIVRAQL